MLNKVFALMSLFTVAPQTSSLALKEQPNLNPATVDGDACQHLINTTTVCPNWCEADFIYPSGVFPDPIQDPTQNTTRINRFFSFQSSGQPDLVTAGTGFDQFTNPMVTLVNDTGWIREVLGKEYSLYFFKSIIEFAAQMESTLSVNLSTETSFKLPFIFKTFNISSEQFIINYSPSLDYSVIASLTLSGNYFKRLLHLGIDIKKEYPPTFEDFESCFVKKFRNLYFHHCHQYPLPILVARLGAIKHMMSLIEYAGHDAINVQSCNGYTPLIISILSKQNDMTTWLIEQGADITAQALSMKLRLDTESVFDLTFKGHAEMKYPWARFSPLAFAINQLTIDIVQLLLMRGVDPNFGSELKDTTIDIVLNGITNSRHLFFGLSKTDKASIEASSIKILKLLLEFGADHTYNHQKTKKHSGFHLLEILKKYFPNVSETEFTSGINLDSLVEDSLKALKSGDDLHQFSLNYCTNTSN